MDTSAIAGAAIGIFLIVMLAIMAGAIFVLIATFKVYAKAGEQGWKCLIPYYNTWTECKFIGLNTNWVWFILGASFLGGFLDGLLEVEIFSFVSGVLAVYFNVIKNVSLARSFGKDTGFGVGLMCVPIVFMPILAFGKAEYIGPRPMKDFIFKEGNTTPTAPVAPQTGAAAVENEILNATPNPVSFPKLLARLTFFITLK